MTSGSAPRPSRFHAPPSALLAVLCVATFMTGLDLFIVNVALPPIGKGFGVSSLADLSWVLNGYAIVFAAMLVPAGRLADRYGIKLVFLLGLATFVLGSLGCALSDDLWLLVGLRCLQAVGAAALVPTSLGLLLTAMPAERVHASIQIWSVTTALGAAAGPALGGLLVQASWRWIFVINIPVGLIALALTIIWAPSTRHSAETRIPDVLGGGLVIVGIGALSLALVEGPTWDWSSGRTLGSFAIAVVAIVLFILRSARATVPVIDLSLFRNWTFRWASAAILVLGVGFGMQLLGLVLWFQEGWGWSPIRTGLAVAPGPAMVMVTAIGLRPFTSKLPIGLVVGAGILLRAVGGALIALSLTTHDNYASEALPGWLIVGIGVGLSMPTLVAAATSGLAPHQSSTGSAVVQMGQQIGFVLGVSILVIVLGSSTGSASDFHSFVHGWWWSAGITIAAILTCIPLLMRTKAADPSTSAAPESAGVGRNQFHPLALDQAGQERGEPDVSA
jgi:EmrB/QacA subfamily drug resistance transporter